MTITEFGPGKVSMCSSTFWINRANVSARKDPSTTSQCKIPFSNDIAESTENLNESTFEQSNVIQLLSLALTAFHEQRMPFVVLLVLESCMHAHGMVSCGQPSSHQQRQAGSLDTGWFGQYNPGVFQPSVLLQCVSSEGRNYTNAQKIIKNYTLSSMYTLPYEASAILLLLKHSGHTLLTAFPAAHQDTGQGSDW